MGHTPTPWTLAVLLAVCPLTAARPQQEPVESASPQTYYEVVDRLFEVARPAKRAIEYEFILRFVPGGILPEAQIVIETRFDGSVEVTHYFLPKGSLSILQQVDALKTKLRTEDAKEIAKHVKVEVRKADVFPSFIRDFVMEFAQLELKPPMETGLWLDSGTFILTFRTNSNELRFSLVGSPSGESQRDHALIRWMNRVKKYVEGAETRK